jgi:integrase
MAHLQQDSRSGKYLIRFRYEGVEYKRSLKTSSRREALAVLGQVDEMLRLLERGRLELPDDADPASFIISNGKRATPRTASIVRTVADLFRAYHDSLPPQAKEPTTLEGEARHVRHLLRHLGASRPIRSLSAADLELYAERRSQDRWRGKKIKPDTIKKELTTFRLVWNWAAHCGHVSGPSPVHGVRLPKIGEKPPFMTWAEIEMTISRGGLTLEQEQELWGSLFLTAEQVDAVLDYVKEVARHEFIYPMFVFAAHTGARRSEILRSRLDDLNFEARIVRIREKKRARTKSVTFRNVDMSRRFFDVMQDWLQGHPGGQFTICSHSRSDTEPRRLSCCRGTDHFKTTLRGSKWEKIRGFHVFRHSFASNAAAAGVDQRIIDEWMGHQTEEMRRRYRHLYPEQRRAAMNRVFCP